MLVLLRNAAHALLVILHDLSLETFQKGLGLFQKFEAAILLSHHSLRHFALLVVRSLEMQVEP